MGYGGGKPYGEHELTASQDIVQEGVVPGYLEGIREVSGPPPRTQGPALTWPCSPQTTFGELSLWAQMVVKEAEKKQMHLI